jgi:enamine deaminase RidA (YjgF/YER057c/UK114 family)
MQHAVIALMFLATPQYINPPALVHNPRYTQVITIPNSGLIFVAGQAATRPDGSMVSTEFDAQAVQALENVRLALKAAGAMPSDIIRINTFIVDLPAHIAAYREAREKFFAGVANLPTSTTVGVPAIAGQDALIEIEVTAYKAKKR